VTASRPDGSVIDKHALLRKYLHERDKRLRPDGLDQYIRLDGYFPDYQEDPYTPRTERAPKTDHRTVVFIGGGLAGLINGARLKQAGVAGVRIVEKGGDFGGAWYWNRYPGVQCDTASLIYLPLLEETGHIPTEKYAHGPEILEHCQRIGKHFGLYDDALFHTEVTDLEWDRTRSRWIVRTNRGDEMTAQFVAMGVGPLHVPKLPGIPGIRDFAGHSFHTSRWDYGYTGGDSLGAPMDKLAGKRVAIIGTGATAVQCIPHLARACRELFVFQRTPSTVDVRDNRPIDPEWFAAIATPGWQQHWMENWAANLLGGTAQTDLVRDNWTAFARRIRFRVTALAPRDRTDATVAAIAEDVDFELMEEIRARVDSVVTDPRTAQRLKAWYRRLCKRPCFHDEYLDAYNRPNTHLVDTDGKGVERITETGVVAAGREYEVDCVIYASGFEVGTRFTPRAGYDMTGRGGVTLSGYWAQGMRTMHGIHVHGFPNAFFAQPFQGANMLFNFPHDLAESAKTITAVIRHALNNGFAEVEVTRQAEDAWINLLLTGPESGWTSPDCTPGYYNYEGRDAGPWGKLRVGYPGGPLAYFSRIDQWRRAGTFAGLEFRRPRLSGQRPDQRGELLPLILPVRRQRDLGHHMADGRDLRHFQPRGELAEHHVRRELRGDAYRELLPVCGRHHDGAADARDVQRGRLDLERAHPGAPVLEHVVPPTLEIEVSVLVQVTVVTGVQRHLAGTAVPAEGAGGDLRRPPVARHHVRAAYHDLPSLPGRQWPARLVHDGHLGARQRQPHRLRAVKFRLGRHDADALAFRDAEHPRHPRAGEPGAQQVDGGLRQGGAGAGEQPHAARARVAPGERREHARH
jgi:cyclohexanone monooxygenase